MERTIAPGVLLLVAVGLAARAVAAVVPVADALVVSLLIGFGLGTVFGVPDWARPGVRTHGRLLETGIVVMGASVALEQVVAAGPTLLLLVVGTVLTTVVAVESIARVALSIRDESASLLAAGSGVCGVSAVVATAESIRADDAHVGYAAATILLFDAVTLLVYPLVGHALDLSSTVFGIWAGLTMFSTGPVTAAGFAFSETAGRWAVLVKLVRNATIGVAAVGYALVYARLRREGFDAAGGPRRLWRAFPKFVVGFFVVAAVANLGVLDARSIASLSNASDWAFLFAFAGLGLEIRLHEIRTNGYRPILAVLLALLLVSPLALLVVAALF
jgi:uncharacterized integral membrane protein (TIGR00698 family)